MGINQIALDGCVADYFEPTHSSYNALSTSDIGFATRLLVDLNISDSEVLFENGRKRKRHRSRIYSLKHSVNSRWKLKGHAHRCVLDDVGFIVSETKRQQVISSQSKVPHAFITGMVTRIVEPWNLIDHNYMLRSFIEKGAIFIAYDPYLTAGFVSTGVRPGLEGIDIDALPILEKCKSVYCYESAVLAIL